MHKALPGRGAKLAAVILAAGASTRLGRSKQLVRIRSVPLLVRAVRLARHAGDGPVIVVLGADALRVTVLTHDATDPDHIFVHS